MLVKTSETSAIGKELLYRVQGLIAHADDVAVKPCLIDDCEIVIREIANVDSEYLRSDLLAQSVDFKH
jgi:hypothetical protein